jgi:predicted anti-sigma-YlaC factor YlaD
VSRSTFAVLLVPVLLVVSSCSVRRFAVNRIGDTLASSSSSTFQEDEDIELVGSALPFGLKLIESLLKESPRHPGLLSGACQGFVLYSHVYVQQEADRLAGEDLERSNALRTRARRLFLRARGYGLRALDAEYPGLPARLETDPAAIAVVKRRKDVPLLYFNAAALGLAISMSRNDAEMLSRVPEVEAMLRRALELDESWQKGTLHEFQIILATTSPAAPSEAGVLRKHFDRALELSAGKRPSVYTTWAEAVSVRTQNRREFRTMLEKALAIDPAANKEELLLNEVSQRRARWLLGRSDELFLDEEKE